MQNIEASNIVQWVRPGPIPCTMDGSSKPFKSDLCAESKNKSQAPSDVATKLNTYI